MSEPRIAFECDIGGETLQVPEELPLLPVRNTLVFPHIQVPLQVGRALSLGAVAEAANGDRLLAVVPQRRHDVEEPGLADLYPVGSVVRILRVVEGSPGRGINVDVVGVARFSLRDVLRDGQMMRARIGALPEILEPTPEAEAARRTVQDLARELIALRDELPDDFIDIDHGDASRLADEIAFASGLSLDQNVALLAEPDVLTRLRILIRHLMHELRIAKVSKRVAQ